MALDYYLEGRNGTTHLGIVNSELSPDPSWDDGVGIVDLISVASAPSAMPVPGLQHGPADSCPPPGRKVLRMITTRWMSGSCGTTFQL